MCKELVIIQIFCPHQRILFVDIASERNCVMKDATKYCGYVLSIYCLHESAETVVTQYSFDQYLLMGNRLILYLIKR